MSKEKRRQMAEKDVEKGEESIVDPPPGLEQEEEEEEKEEEELPRDDVGGGRETLEEESETTQQVAGGIGDVDCEGRPMPKEEGEDAPSITAPCQGPELHEASETKAAEARTRGLDGRGEDNREEGEKD